MKKTYIRPILNEYEYNLETVISTSSVVTNKTFDNAGLGTDATADWDWQ